MNLHYLDFPHQPFSNNCGCSLDVVDIDGDGDLDILSSDGYGEVHLYRNMTINRQ